MNVPKLSEAQMKAYNTLVDAGLPAEAKVYLAAATAPAPLPVSIATQPKVEPKPPIPKPASLKPLPPKIGGTRKAEPVKAPDAKTKGLGEVKGLTFTPKTCRPCFDRFRRKSKGK